MWDSLTPGARRALARSTLLARSQRSAALLPAHILCALLAESESHAAALLAQHGFQSAQSSLAQIIPPLVDDLESDRSAPEPLESLPWSPETRALLTEALHLARSLERANEVSTEHLLLALIESCPDLAADLASAGLVIPELSREIRAANLVQAAPIELDASIPPLELSTPAETVDLFRILDAAANRAREGLRVIEDYLRFVLDDPHLVRRAKEIRHRLAEALRGLDPEGLIAARDTQGDVGTHISTPAEHLRENPRAVLVANFKRTAEALRSLEEYSKLLEIWVAARCESLRYDIYILEKRVLTAVTARASFHEPRLYLLVGGLPTLADLAWIVGEALAGGVQVVQLREKNLPDRTLLEHARELRILTAQAGARFVMNDRPDLARIAGADAVHLGQQDMRLRDARRVLGTRALIGVSTHSPQQIEAAAQDGAGYLGVGPVFPSQTKEFEHLAGLALVRHAAAATALPWFAIGGIRSDNLESVLEAGATRVAVSSAILKADRPRAAAAALRAALDAAPTQPGTSASSHHP
jgi:thiamine-phosphate pyrophosphorylase